MRAVLDFTDGFGSDPTSMLGPVASSDKKQVSSTTASNSARVAVEAHENFPSYVPGPFQAPIPAGVAPSLSEAALLTQPGFASGGFRPQLLADETEEDELVCREPQSVVVTAILVGILLAALGYILDL